MTSWLKLAASLSVTVLCSCATPPNVEGCVRLNRGAACAYTLVGPDRDFSEAQWQKKRIGRISFAPEDYAKIRAYIEEQCEKAGPSCQKKLKARLKHIEKRLCSKGQCRGNK